LISDPAILIELEISKNKIECKNIQGRGIGELGNLWKIIAVEITGHFEGHFTRYFVVFRGNFRKFEFFSDYLMSNFFPPRAGFSLLWALD
jgi:hypothetical protein